MAGNQRSVRWVPSKLDKDLCTACKKGKLEDALRAIKEGANVNCHITMALGESIPLFLCANKGHIEIAKALLEHGADINLKLGFDGSTALHSACTGNQLDMVKFLIEHGSKIDATNKLNKTPLMDAAHIGSPDIVEYLVSKGADQKLQDKSNRTALSFAVDNVNKREKRWYNTAKRLVELGSDVQTSGGFAGGVTILHCAAAEGDLEFIRDLVENRGANCLAQDDTAQTPITYAEKMGHDEIVQYFNSKLNERPCCIIQ